jgi:hypothetical protein
MGQRTASTTAGRGVVRYAAAATAVRTADAGVATALVLLALERTGSAAIGGALVAAATVTHVVAGPVAGAMATARGRSGRCTWRRSWSSPPVWAA